MNLPSAIAIAAGAISVYVGLVARGFAKAPGWTEQRRFSVIAFSGAVYSFGNVATTLGLADGVVVACSHLQLAALLVQAWGWFRFVDAITARHPGRLERRVLGLLLGLAALALVPGVVYDGTVVGHRIPSFAATYRDALPTHLGEAVFAIGYAASLVMMVRLVAAWRRGLPDGALYTVAFGLLLLFGLNDALVASRVYSSIYLLDVGFVIPVGAMAFSLTRRFVQDARALHALRDRLEALVEARTHELTELQQALHQAEKLASLGQFAAGVAHEVNNPASVVTSTLNYLEESFASGRLPPDARDATVEALSAMQRINILVRRLVDAGRLARTPASGGTASVRTVIEQALDDLRARSDERVEFRLEGVPELHAGLRPEQLSQILSALLHNAAEAISEGGTGHVTVGAEPVEDGRIRIAVTDDGAGMAPEVLRRAFEPFFSTKGEGRGSGLGLPVARALTESFGGELRLESRQGHGTTATLTLPEAPPPA